MIKVTVSCLSISGRQMPSLWATKYPPIEGWFYRWFLINWSGSLPLWQKWLHHLIADWHDLDPDKIDMAWSVRSGRRLKAIYRVRGTNRGAP